MSKIQNISIETKKSRFILTKSQFISTKSRLFTNISKNLVLSRFVSKVSISLDDLDKNLDTSLSRLKSLDFKNLDRDKMKVDLDRRENLDGFQKLVSTLRTFSISISICLDVETTKLKITLFIVPLFQIGDNYCCKFILERVNLSNRNS